MVFLKRTVIIFPNFRDIGIRLKLKYTDSPPVFWTKFDKFVSKMVILPKTNVILNRKSIDLMKLLSEEMNFTFSINVVKDGEYGFWFDNLSNNF